MPHGANWGAIANVLSQKSAIRVRNYVHGKPELLSILEERRKTQSTDQPPRWWLLEYGSTVTYRLGSLVVKRPSSDRVVPGSNPDPVIFKSGFDVRHLLTIPDPLALK